MRLKVVHEGSYKVSGGFCSYPITKIIDAETGSELENVKSVSFEHNGGEHPILRLELLDFELDVELDAEVENAKHEN